MSETMQKRLAVSPKLSIFEIAALVLIAALWLHVIVESALSHGHEFYEGLVCGFFLCFTAVVVIWPTQGKDGKQ